MMRMNYKSYPTDYIRLLKTEKSNGRKKSRAFMEYWDDMEHGDHNSFRFYAKSWEVSTSTTFEWIKEFDKEIELFLSHWIIRNKQHYNYTQNQTERLPNEEFNINNNKNTRETKSFWNDKDFNDLFFIYGQNTKFKGKKEDAYQAFLHVDTNVDLLKLASVRYLHDPDTTGKRYNLTNFLKNQTYISYLPTRMKITISGKIHLGTYDQATCRFISDTKDFAGELSAKRLVEMFESKELEFIK